MSPKTAERLFLEAFAPCALLRSHAHESTLTEEDRVNLSSLLANGGNPKMEQLKDWFPIMFAKWRNFAQEHGLRMRALETVQAFRLHCAKTMQSTLA